jgi:uncharacterized membrane protein YebE (DUF533 family)
MFDAKQLLDQFLGGNPGAAGANPPGGLAQRAGQMATQARDRLNQASGAQAFGAGALTGGLLGMLVGGKKMKKLASGAVGYGGAAVLGAIAYQTWQSYRASQAGMGQKPTTNIDPAQALATTAPALLPHAQPATDGGPFALVLLRGMIAAAKADGHVDADEQRRLFTEVERMELDAEGKALVFDALSQPVDIPGLVAQVATPEQAAELYLASRLAIDPDHPAERAYLDALAVRLGLPAEVRASLEQTLA